MPTWEDYVAFARQYPGEYDIPEEETTGDPFEIAPEDIPTGDSTEDRRARQKIIRRYYKHWQEIHPEKRMFNTSLNDWIYVNQQQFSKMIQLRHTLPGIGRVRLMVGVKRQDSMKVQYCITSIDAMLEAKKQSSLK